MKYELKSFAVGSTGSDEYRDNYDRTFRGDAGAAQGGDEHTPLPEPSTIFRETLFVLNVLTETPDAAFRTWPDDFKEVVYDLKRKLALIS